MRNFHKTNFEHCGKTPGIQKSNPISSRESRRKCKRWKQRQKILGQRLILRRESWKRSFHTVRNPLTGVSVGSSGIQEGNITRSKKKVPQNTSLTWTTLWDMAQMLTSSSTKWGPGKEAWAALLVLRVSSSYGYPEDNVRELMWDYNPNHWITRERDKQTNKQTFPMKTLNPPMTPGALTEKRIEGIQKEDTQLPYRALPTWSQRGRFVTARATRQGAAAIWAPATASPTKL